MKRIIFPVLFCLTVSSVHAQLTNSIVDIRDGQIYNIVKIGQQWWMQENLTIGSRINGGQNPADNGVIEKYCYDDNTNNCDIYGGLYQWDEMMDYSLSDSMNPGITQGICPTGWHLPSDAEWKELEMYLGMSQAEADGTSYRGIDEGVKLKETSTIHWAIPNTEATNESGFTALPGGYLDYGGSFYALSYVAHFWSSTEYNSYIAWDRFLNYDDSKVARPTHYKEDGFSVRCLRDSSQFSYLTVSDINLETISKLYFTDEQAIDTIIIINSSVGQTINVASIHTNTSAYNLNKSSAILLPGDSIHINVAFNPPIKGKYYFDTIQIESNDPYNPIIGVPLNGYMKTDTIIDIRDGQVYSVVKIGQQWWIQENLKIGIRIDGTQDASDNGIIEKYCYNDNDSLCNIYGGLYIWSEMMDYNPSDIGHPSITQGVCPLEWHLPSDSEWTELNDLLGGEYVAGEKLKETGTMHWQGPNVYSTNESGFTALPSGYWDDGGSGFANLGIKVYFFSSTLDYSSVVVSRALTNGYPTFNRFNMDATDANPVRCLRDSSRFSYLTVYDTSLTTILNLNFYNEDASKQVVILNSALRTINISSIYNTNSAYTLSQSSLDLQPGDSIHLNITFNPPIKDIYLDTLHIISNDPYNPLITIPLNGTFSPEILFTDSTNISCFGYSDGSATITPSLGTSPYQYQWDDPGNTADSTVTGLMANTYYHVTVVDSKGYLVSDSIILSEPQELTILDSIKDVSITGGSDGIIDISITGGTKPYGYHWSNDSVSEDLVGISTGEYQLIVEDHNGCTKDETFRVKEPITLQFDKIDVSCYGVNDGRIDITILGGHQPYIIEWSNDATTGYIENLQNGKYIVIVTDDFGASAIDSVDITEPEPLEILSDYSEIICQGNTDGYIDLYPSGGTSPYEYAWADGTSSQTLSGLETGDYRVKITDSHGCIDSASFIIHPVVPYDGERICIVTVDLLTGENLVIWEKTADKGIVSYNIYREKGLIGTVGYNDLSIFKDTIADPEKRTYLYALSVVDSCSNESELSPYHKPLFLQYVSSVGGVNLSWSKYEIEGEIVNFDNYSIYRGSNLTVLSPLEDNIPTEINNYRDTDPQSLLNKFYYRVAGRLTEPCTPTGNLKGVEVDYSLTMSNFDDNQIVSVQDTKFSDQLTVYPNPFNESTTIKFKNPEKYSYTLYLKDLTGKVVKTIDNLTEERLELDRNVLPAAGLYLLELRGPNIYRGKIIIE